MTDPNAPDGFENELRSGLANLASVPDVSARHAHLDGELARRRRLGARRLFLVGAAASTTVVVAGAAGAWRLASRDQSPAGEVITGSTPSTPLTANSWQPIASAPLSARSAPAVVWASDRLIVWGGVGFAGGVPFTGDIGDDRLPPDGAAWSPTEQKWTPIAAGPAGAIRGGFAEWNGSEVLVGVTEADSTAPWNKDVSEEQARYGIAAYRPSSDAWRYVGPVTPDTDERLGSARQAVALGDSLLVALRSALPGTSGHDRDIVVIDVATGAERPVDPGPFAVSPYADRSGTVALTRVGAFVVATTTWDRRPWVLDLATESWHHAPAPKSASLHLRPATAAASTALFLESDSVANLWLLDPTDQGPNPWRPARTNPLPWSRWTFEPVWSGHELFVPGAAYDPATNQWRPVEAPPRGKSQQRTLTSRWANDSLLLFGGEEHTCPDNGRCDRSLGPDTLNGWAQFTP